MFKNNSISRDTTYSLSYIILETIPIKFSSFDFERLKGHLSHGFQTSFSVQFPYPVSCKTHDKFNKKCLGIKLITKKISYTLHIYNCVTYA